MRSEIEEALFNYFYTHPNKSVDDLLDVADKAYSRAKKQVIPRYNPKAIEDLRGVPDEYDVERKQAQHKEYHDQSTYE